MFSIKVIVWRTGWQVRLLRPWARHFTGCLWSLPMNSYGLTLRQLDSKTVSKFAARPNGNFIHSAGTEPF